MIVRKGIYNHFHPGGDMQADERWQLQSMPDGSVQFDNETDRITPFAEPRSDSVTCMLDSGLTPTLFTLHGLFGHREARISWVDDEAFTCWQHGLNTQRRTLPWSRVDALHFNSPVIDSLLLRRLAPFTGKSLQQRWLHLDPISCEPSWQTVEVLRHKDEDHRTRFGNMQLRRYTIDQPGIGATQLWTDDSDLIFDQRFPDGSSVLLVAVNFPD